MSYFRDGFKKMIPVLTGVVPFGAVMGTVSADAKLGLHETVSMNLLNYAGAAQLAAVELMTKHTPIFVVVVTGLVINLRFLLYSAALSPLLKGMTWKAKFLSAYWLTDQAYAVVSANEDRLPGPKETIHFYLGASLCMAICWHLSVVAGFLFGNFAPQAWSLEYAVPLSFIVMLVPTLKTRTHVVVATFSAVASAFLHVLPLRLGLVTSAVLAMLFAFVLTKKRGVVA